MSIFRWHLPWVQLWNHPTPGSPEVNVAPPFPGNRMQCSLVIMQSNFVTIITMSTRIVCPRGWGLGYPSWVHTVLCYRLWSCMGACYEDPTSIMQTSLLGLTVQWRHNECDGASKHARLDCLLNCWFRHRSKKTSKLRVTGLCEGNPSVTGESPSQRASNAENVSIWWRHHDIPNEITWPYFIIARCFGGCHTDSQERIQCNDHEKDHGNNTSIQWSGHENCSIACRF